MSVHTFIIKGFGVESENPEKLVSRLTIKAAFIKISADMMPDIAVALMMFIIKKLICMGTWTDKGCKGASSCYGICTNLTNTPLFVNMAPHSISSWQYMHSASVVSVFRIQGSERRTRAAWSGVTRRSRTHGATR